MNKLIYLYELDSTRTTKEEVILGQQAMIHEIVHNGNQIVMTYSQIVDSKVFLSMLMNDECYKLLIHFIQEGFIKFSQYYDKDGFLIATPVQYVRNALSDDDFIFSSLPVGVDNVLIKELLGEALMNVNLGVLDHENIPCNVSCYLKKFVSMVTLLSLEQKAINKPLDKKVGFVSLSAFLDVILNNYLGDCLYYCYLGDDSFPGFAFEDFDRLLKLMHSTVEYLKTLELGGMNHRSSLLTCIRSNTDDEAILALSECIVDLCYNYASETSIANVSKHYNDTSSFISDFSFRLLGYWMLYLDNKHKFIEYNDSFVLKDIEVLLVEWNAVKEVVPTVEFMDYKGLPYSLNKEQLKKDKRIWKKKLYSNYFRGCISACVLIATFYLFDYSLNHIIYPMINNVISLIDVPALNILKGLVHLYEFNHLMNYEQYLLYLLFVLSIVSIVSSNKKVKYFKVIWLVYLIGLCIGCIDVVFVGLFFTFNKFFSITMFTCISINLSRALHIPDLFDVVQGVVVRTKALFVLRKPYKHVYEITIADHEVIINSSNS